MKAIAGDIMGTLTLVPRCPLCHVADREIEMPAEHEQTARARIVCGSCGLAFDVACHVEVDVSRVRCSDAWHARSTLDEVHAACPSCEGRPRDRTLPMFGARLFST